MHKFYKLKYANTHQEGMLKTMLTIQEELNYEYFDEEIYKSNMYWESPMKILMTFATKSGDYHNTHTYKFSDLMEYFRLVFSPAFKKLISTYQISDHTFYEVEAEGGEVKEYPTMLKTGDIRKYFIFHILKSYKYVDFSKSQFGIYNDTSERFEEVFPEGFIQSEQHLQEYNKEFAESYYKNPETYIVQSKIGERTRKIWKFIQLYKVTYSEHFDVFTKIGSGRVLINERVKNALEQSNLTGWQLEEYGEYEIVMSKN